MTAKKTEVLYAHRPPPSNQIIHSRLDQTRGVDVTHPMPPQLMQDLMSLMRVGVKLHLMQVLCGARR